MIDIGSGARKTIEYQVAERLIKYDKCYNLIVWFKRIVRAISCPSTNPSLGVAVPSSRRCNVPRSGTARLMPALPRPEESVQYESHGRAVDANDDLSASRHFVSAPQPLSVTNSKSSRKKCTA